MTENFEILGNIVTEQPCSYGSDLGISDHEASVVKVSNIDRDGRFHNEFETRTFTQIEFDKLVCQKNDLLVVKSSGSKANILSGKTAIVVDETNLVASNFTMRLRPDVERVYPKYLWYFLNSQTAKKFVKSIVGTTTYPNLKWAQYSQLRVPLPSLDSQKQISQILDHADALRIKDQELLQKYDELSRSIFAEMFGDPAKNEKGWDKIKLENCLEKGEKISYGIVQPGDEVEEGIPVIRVRDFESMHVRRDRVRMVHPNCESKHKKTRLIGDELLIGCVGSVGKIALVDESLKGYNIVRATARVRVNPNKINRTFLAFALSHQSIQNHFISETRTVSQPTLNIKQIGATEIIAPPIATQRKFNLIIENIFTLSKLVKSSSVEMLFSSLLQNSFFLEQAETVELRVN